MTQPSYGCCEFIGHCAVTSLPVHEYRSTGRIYWTIGERIVYARPGLIED